jgi:hypothetical protein
VANPDYRDDELILDYLVNDPVVSDPSSSEAGELTFQDSAGVGLLSKAVNGLDEANTFVVKQMSGLGRAILPSC